MTADFSFERVEHMAAVPINIPTRVATREEVEAALRARGIATTRPTTPTATRGKDGVEFAAKVYREHKRTGRSFTVLWREMGWV
jgi:hypothetical protein